MVLFTAVTISTWIQNLTPPVPKLTGFLFAVKSSSMKSESFEKNFFKLFLKKHLPRNRYIGHRPDIGLMHNSGYMADHIEPFVQQVKKWMDSDTLISHSQQPEHLAALGLLLVYL